MVGIYNIADIILGRPTYSGHEVYLDAAYRPSQDPNDLRKVIFKRNKYGDEKLTRLEVAFSQLARLFFDKNITSYQKLVVDSDDQIVGLVVQHIVYVIGEKEGLSQPFYTFNDPAVNCDMEKQTVDIEKIPFYFFDKLPHSFFCQLLAAERENKLKIDYESLASILATCYTMEEDDLHKGNFGFYIVEKAGKPTVVFYKIDHDLMFVDSIMGFCTRRPYHLAHGRGAFDITADDLLRFPDLHTSSNAYWPTKTSYLYNPWDSKEYHQYSETQAFASLRNNPEFNKAKWMAFYKHSLIPTALMQNAIKDCIKENYAVDRAHANLIIQAMTGRQACLKSMLLSIPEFQQFIRDLPSNEKQTLFNQIVDSATADQELIKKQLTVNMDECDQFCARNNALVDGDTPLHVAIKTGNYRYTETLDMFGHLINVRNSAGKTPLDMALDMYQVQGNTSNNPGKDLCLTMKHLLENGAQPSIEFRVFNQNHLVESYRFKANYYDRVFSAKNYREFKKILRDIGEDHTYCLKFKKDVAVECIKHYIANNRENLRLPGQLKQLICEMDGNSTPKDCAGIQYIRQLRSKLWIVRQIRGLFGITSTQYHIHTLIEDELERRACNKTGYPSFFTNSPPPATPGRFSNCKMDLNLNAPLKK